MRRPVATCVLVMGRLDPPASVTGVKPPWAVPDDAPEEVNDEPVAP
jgi:hypothetical protein